MEEKGSEIQSWEATKGRINATESRIQWFDQQLKNSKGLRNLLKRQSLKKKREEDLHYLEKLNDQTSAISIDDAVNSVNKALERSEPSKKSSE